MMCRNSNTNTNNNMTLTVTPQGNSAPRKWSAINHGLIARAKVNDPKAQFQLGMITLCEGRVGFARACLRDAAKNGNEKAQRYLALLNTAKCSVSQWRNRVIDLEAKHIMFGD